MVSGPGDEEIRKVQLTGGATYTISLPKKWVVANEIQPRDSLRLDWRPSGAIRLTPLHISEQTGKRLDIIADKLPQGSLHDHLMAAYISGGDLIKVRYESGSEKKYSREIRRFLRNTRGFEILAEDDESQSLVCLIKSGEMPLQSSLNRMYFLLSSLSRDVMAVFGGEDLEILSDDGERESEVDAMHYLIERQVGVLLDFHAVAASLDINRNQAVQCANLANSLERMMDHMFQITTLIRETQPLPKLDAASEPLIHIPVWQSALKQMMIDIRTRDSHSIEKARESLRSAQKELGEHEERMMVDKKRRALPMLFEFRLSESIRRLCAYALDIGETLLNMKAYDEMIIEYN